MPWTTTEHSPNTLTRPLGPNEVFIKLVSDIGHPLGREHWAVNYTVTIRPRGEFAADLLPTLIRHSWLHLRFQHPSLAAHPDSSDANLVYTVPESADTLNQWASQTFFIKSDAQSADDVIRTIAPALDAQLYYIPKSSQLLLHTAHWRTDGVGGFLLLGQLVDLMASHADTLLSGSLPDPFDACAWGTETTRLSPSVEEAGNMPLTPTDEQKAIAQEAVGTFAHVQGARRHYTSTIRHTLRPYMPEPYSGPAGAATLFTTGWMYRVDPTSSWEENARKYHAEYRRGLSKEYLLAHREYATMLVGLLRNLPAPEEPPSDFDISSLGVLEKYLQREYGSPKSGFSILHAGLGVEMLARQGVVYVWTFRDQLTLRVVFNEAYHTEEQMWEFLRDVKADLLRELGVKE
ncbi:Membrane dipeptidase (Peptidase M19) family protein [Aspergillus niger]|uniref:Membrane dipeptidase (Peptidase M19) family protein n=1 Tax=Aspergillus niger TaxID=5061 RepID=A0A505IJI0_ASPNG|nr:Membrane dipeptidase (Peptidase M19) family protein [Aspergillus niger]